MNERQFSESTPLSNGERRSRLSVWLAKLALPMKEAREMIDDVQYGQIRERYWYLRRQGRHEEAEAMARKIDASTWEAILYGPSLVIDPNHAAAPRMDARGKDFSGLSDLALSIAVKDRVYGFFSVEDLTPEDRARVIDISEVDEEDRRSAIREFLAYAPHFSS